MARGPAGLGKRDRARLSTVLRGTRGTITVGDAARLLEVSRSEAAKLLSRWASKGWLSRVQRGLYVPVPLESADARTVIEDPWVVAARLYAPCYIGGWSAAEHWDLTEQIFRATLVMTQRAPRDRAPVLMGTPYVIHTVPENAFFGLRPVWRGQVKVQVSDPTRTILDMLDDPGRGGGLRPSVDVLRSYLRSEHRDLDRLADYATRLGNGAVFKRLGFLLERLAPEAGDAISYCRDHLTTGNARLDPQLPADRLITRWRLWIPPTWAREAADDRPPGDSRARA